MTRIKKKVKNILGKIILSSLNSLSRKDKNILLSSFLIARDRELYAGYCEKYSISKSFRFNGTGIQLYGDGQIFLGENSYIGNYSTIQASKNKKVIIGENCAISHNVRIYTASVVADQDLNVNQGKNIQEGDVRIGNGVWIGANVFIKEGVVIEDNVVIGANSVVTKSLKKESVYGGVPAKFIRNKILK